MAAPYVRVRTKNDGCGAQTNPTPDQPYPRPDPRPDPNPNPNPNPTPNPLGGSRSALLEVGRGSIEFTCKSENLVRTYVQLNASSADGGSQPPIGANLRWSQ